MRKFLSIGLAFGILACHKPDSATSDHLSTADAKFGDATSAAGPGHQSAGYVFTKISPELRLRADSLSALDPAQQARAAVRAGELRYNRVIRDARNHRLPSRRGT